ncbi:MAG: hypothetical protein V7K72_09830 [Nostoc sp.]
MINFARILSLPLKQPMHHHQGRSLKAVNFSSLVFFMGIARISHASVRSLSFFFSTLVLPLIP